MYISGAKFKEHCFNSSRDILDWVLYSFSGTTYDVITFLIQKREYLYNEKRYSRKKNAILLNFKKPFKYAAIYLLLHRHFKQCCVTITQDEQWSGNLACSFSSLVSYSKWIFIRVELRLQFQSLFKGSEVLRSKFSRSEFSRYLIPMQDCCVIWHLG